MKNIILGIIFFLVFPISTVFALEIANIDSLKLQSGQTYTLELVALPQNNENGIRLNIIVSGATIENFGIYNKDEWLITTNDCKNNEKITNNSICTSLIKTSPLQEGESLGFLELKINNSKDLSIYKAVGTQYSNGVAIREDLGEMIPIKLAQNSQIEGDVSIPENDPLVVYFLIGLGVAILIILISTIILAFKKKPESNFS